MKMASEQLSPMENPAVLKRIFGYCGVSDMKTIRLVNRQWNKDSLQRWRSAVWVHLEFGRYQNPVQKFASFVKTKKSRFDEHPFEKYVLSRGVAKSFTNTCGKFVKQLTLFRVEFRKVADLRAVIFVACPLLEKLTLSDITCVPSHNRGQAVEPLSMNAPHGANRNMKSLIVTSDNSWFGISASMTWMEILIHYPNLTEISYLEGGSDLIERLFSALVRIRKAHPGWLNLTSLTIPGIPGQGSAPRSNPNHHGGAAGIAAILQRIMGPGGAAELGRFHGDSSREYLSNARTKLSKFGIAKSTDNWNSFLSVVMAGQGKHLKTLALPGYRSPVENDYFYDDENQRILVEFELQNHRGFENLQELALSGASLGSLAFLKWLPNLISFKLHSNGVLSRSTPDKMRTVRLGKVEALELTDYTHGDRNIDGIFQWFPNVKKLTVDDWSMGIAAKGLFGKVCQNWKGLEQIVSLGRSWLSDADITGLGYEQMSETYDLGMDELKAKMDSIKTDKPNITWLTELRSFIQTSKGNPEYDVVLDNSSALFGFLKMAKLTHLRIPKAMMSDEVICALKEKIVCVEIGKVINGSDEEEGECANSHQGSDDDSD